VITKTEYLVSLVGPRSVWLHEAGVRGLDDTADGLAAGWSAREAGVTRDEIYAALARVYTPAWARKYHTAFDLETVPEGRFMVDGILYEGSINALAGYAGDRKSIISLNLTASCLKGTPFMGRYAVANPPKRVIYLCPEMGLRELAKFTKSLGMMPYVGKTFFVRTLDKEGRFSLKDFTPEEVKGALIILDTAVRFIEGKENDPQDMARFSDQLFALRAAGATSWVLFHSSKASTGQELTLTNAVRGSGEIAACLSMCWATRLNDPDPDHRYTSLSRMYPVKVREFEAKSFEFECDIATAECRAVGDPSVALPQRKGKPGPKRTPQELADDESALAFMQLHPELGGRRLSAAVFVMLGIKRNKDWYNTRRKPGSTVTEGN
jgi:hypothetical protein